MDRAAGASSETGSTNADVAAAARAGDRRGPGARRRAADRRPRPAGPHLGGAAAVRARPVRAAAADGTARRRWGWLPLLAGLAVAGPVAGCPASTLRPEVAQRRAASATASWPGCWPRSSTTPSSLGIGLNVDAARRRAAGADRHLAGRSRGRTSSTASRCCGRCCATSARGTAPSRRPAATPGGRPARRLPRRRCATLGRPGAGELPGDRCSRATRSTSTAPAGSSSARGRDRGARGRRRRSRCAGRGGTGTIAA